MKSLLALLLDEQGAVMAEYALLLAVVTLGTLAALQSLSDSISQTFNAVTEGMESANGSSGRF